MKLSPIGTAVSLALSAALSGCASMNTYVTPLPEYELCAQRTSPTGTSADTLALVGDMKDALHCAESWRAAYYQALRAQSQQRVVGNAALLALSATALYLGITDRGSSANIAALGLGSALIYGNSQINAPNARSKVYAAGFSALTCTMLQSRPLMMTFAEKEQLSSAIRFQSHQVSILTAALARSQHLGTSGSGYSAAQIAMAENTLTAMKGDLDRASVADREISQGGSHVRQQIFAVVGAVNEQLGLTEPEPEAVLAVAKGLPEIASTLAHGYLPQPAAGDAGDGGGDGTARKMGGTRGADGVGAAGTPAIAPPSITCPSPGDEAKVAEQTASSDLGQALFCAQLGAERLRPLVSRLQGLETVTAAIEGCTNDKTKGTSAGLVISPDQASIAMVAGGRFSLTVHSDIGIPDVRLVGNAAGALERELEPGLGFLSITLHARAPTPSPVQLTIVAPDGRTRMIPVNVRASEPSGNARPLATRTACGARSADTPTWRRRLDIDECGVLGRLERVQALQCKLGVARLDNDGDIGSDTRQRIAIANRALGLGKQGNKVTQDLIDALTEDRPCPETAESHEALRARLDKLPKVVVVN